ncbi:MAG TPA: pyridoxal phosphate-dependent aminotransferase [bacterium]|nr:pyridoxal phosphate-dependent aminotransferase [bacterium]HQI47673.1 pyridoxal phosphate-dependent aminotransferase [bacterium]HQJ63362.1 pyridoxal phosphate-dependent aminotransferase [bacterium]
MELAKRLERMTESPTVALNSTLARLKREGKDVVALGAGEPDFDTPAHINAAAIAAINQGYTKYTAAEGSLELREAIGNWLEETYQVRYSPKEIVVTPGAKYAVFEAILAVCDPGSEVVLPSPYWVSYPEMIQLADATMRCIDPADRDHLKITPAELRAAITDKTRLVILNSPSNPSGAVYSRQELAALVEVIRAAGVWLLSDEIYDQIVFDEKGYTSLSQFPEIRDKLLLVNGVSKSCAMTGWRIGFLAAPTRVAAAVVKYQGHTVSNPTSISQKAALAGYRGSKAFIEEMNAAFRTRRDYLFRRLQAIPRVRCLLPQGAFYLFPDVSAYYGHEKKGYTVDDSVSLCQYLLQEFGVAIVPGVAFGMDTHVRLSYATSMEVLEKALDRIESGLHSLL